MKVRYLVTMAIFAGTFASTAFAVIYGSDDRHDLDVPNLPQAAYDSAASTALMVSKKQLRAGDKDTWRLSSQKLKNKYNLCEADRFGEQPAPGFCSGFLAAPDLVITAGHCITSQSMCRMTAIVFGFDSTTDPAVVSADNVYDCLELVVHRSDPKSGMDFALIKLDRPVIGRTPLPIRREGELQTGTEVVAIGHPHGGPTKIITGAQVRQNDSDASYFVANIDGFMGNSGSPVIIEDGMVEGIIVRGEVSYRETPQCLAPLLCNDDSCRGEDVLKANTFLEYLPQ